MSGSLRLAFVFFCLNAALLTAEDLRSGAEAEISSLAAQADTGDLAAQLRLARVHDLGDRARGLPANEALATQWYRRAAEQGDAGAQFALGVRRATRTLQLIGIERPPNKAMLPPSSSWACSMSKDSALRVIGTKRCTGMVRRPRKVTQGRRPSWTRSVALPPSGPSNWLRRTSSD